MIDLSGPRPLLRLLLVNPEGIRAGVGDLLNFEIRAVACAYGVHSSTIESIKMIEALQRPQRWHPRQPG